MQNLFEFLKKYNYWFLFIILETISFLLLFRFNSYQGSAWFTSANYVAAKVNGWNNEVKTYINLKDVNTELTRQNILLQENNAHLRELLDKENATVTRNDIYLDNALKGFHLIPAHVTSNSIIKNENYIVIDKGEADGVKTEMGVVGGGGVVGITFLTGEHYSLVLPIINIKSNTSCRIRHQNFFGNLQWTGGSTLHAYLNDIPRYAKIKIGENVETSGYSTVFPPGLFVGRVTKIANAPDGLSLQLDVNLGTNFATLSDVNIIVNENRAEIDSLRVKVSNFESIQE